MSETRIVTLGCRLNTYESEVMRDHAESAGLEDAIVINTCAVTGEAERQARQTIRRLRRENPGATIIVTGCAAQIHPDNFAAMPEVNRVLGNREKMQAESFRFTPAAAEDATPVDVTDIMNAKETAHHLIGGFGNRARAFVQVQQGCDHRCTFCIIPFGRGPNRSLSAEGITKQVRALVEGGFKEVVLSGVDLTSYGADLPNRPTLGQMVKKLLTSVPNLERLRLSSLDPAAVDQDLFDAIINEARLMPHIHLSLQAGDDMILKRMKRRHTRAQAIELCERLRANRDDLVFGADLIAGFPTETEEMFENSLRLVEDCGLTFLHVFPYSSRPGTPAAKMPDLPGDLRKERAAKIRAVGDQAFNAYAQSRIGSRARVLIEKENEGLCEHYVRVRLDENAEPGSIVPVRLTGLDGETLLGTRDE